MSQGMGDCIIPHDVKLFVLWLACKKNRAICNSNTFRNVTYEYNLFYSYGAYSYN